MKFEKPVMNISMFVMENVLTASGEAPVEPTNLTAAEYAETLEVDAVVKLTF